MLLASLAAGHQVALVYLDTLKKKLSQQGFASLTLIHGPNLIGHPILLVALLSFGFFHIPQHLEFFGWWATLTGVSIVQFTLQIWGLVRSSFFAVQALARSSFAVSATMGAIILQENLQPIQWLAIGIALAGSILFVVPKRRGLRWHWDSGLVFTLISVLLGGCGAILYKVASSTTSSYFELLSGRIVGDLIGWTAVWFVVLLCMRRQPVRELIRCLHNPTGAILLFGTASRALLNSWLIFMLPVSTLSMLNALAIPISYFVERYEGKQNRNWKQFAGSGLILLALLLFIWNPK